MLKIIMGTSMYAPRPCLRESEIPSISPTLLHNNCDNRVQNLYFKHKSKILLMFNTPWSRVRASCIFSQAQIANQSFDIIL